MSKSDNDSILFADHVIYGRVEIKQSEWNRGARFVRCRLISRKGPPSSPDYLSLGRIALKLR